MANTAGSDPDVTDCEFTGNFTVSVLNFGFGGGMYNKDSSPTVSSRFINNSADYGGGIFNHVSGRPVVKNSLFSGNMADDAGGGLFNDVGVTLVVINCVFDGNVTSDVLGNTDSEGGALNLRGLTTVTNCTFSNNVTQDQGTGLGLGGAVWLSADVTMNNCVMWGDTATQGDEIYIEADGALTIDFGDAEGGEAAVFKEPGGFLDWGDGNIGELPAHDPLFAGSGSGNLHIKPGSPCIDAADNNADTDANTPGVQPLPSTDLDGSPRFVDDPDTPGTGNGVEPFVDMGAYEFQLCPGASGTCPWDLFPEVPDNIVGAGDLAELLGAWGLNPGHPADFNCDAFVKALDLATLLGNWGPCP